MGEGRYGEEYTGDGARDQYMLASNVPFYACRLTPRGASPQIVILTSPKKHHVDFETKKVLFLALGKVMVAVVLFLSGGNSFRLCLLHSFLVHLIIYEVKAEIYI